MQNNQFVIHDHIQARPLRPFNASDMRDKDIIENIPKHLFVLMHATKMLASDTGLSLLHKLHNSPSDEARRLLHSAKYHYAGLIQTTFDSIAQNFRPDRYAKLQISKGKSWEDIEVLKITLHRLR